MNDMASLAEIARDLAPLTACPACSGSVETLACDCATRSIVAMCANSDCARLLLLRDGPGPPCFRPPTPAELASIYDGPHGESILAIQALSRGTWRPTPRRTVDWQTPLVAGCLVAMMGIAALAAWMR